MHEDHHEPTPALLACNGLRCTKQRVALYDALRASKTHPTAEELFRQTATRVDGLSLATVYNAMEVFCRAGLAQRLAAVPGRARRGGDADHARRNSTRYDATVHNHLHVRCKKTGQVRDVPDDLGEKLLEHIPRDLLDELESRLGFQVKQVQIELWGEYR